MRSKAFSLKSVHRSVRTHGPAFDKDQRVSHAAIVENKRLGEVLAFIKSQQDARPSVRVKTISERIGYQKTGRKPPGKPRLVDKLMTKRRTGERQAS